MISKAVRGQGFSGAVGYVCDKASSIRMLNLGSQSWKNAAKEMRHVADLNTTKKCVYHHWLSFDPAERLNDEAMFKAAALMIEKLGLSEHQNVMALHKDRDHLHVHIVSNLVSFDGKAVKLSHDFRARPIYAREIESEMGLKAFEYKERSTHKVGAERIEQIKIALQSAKSEDDLRRRLDQIGVSVNEKSSRQNAVNFRIVDRESGASIPGSKIDPALTSPRALKSHFSSEKTIVRQTAAVSKTAPAKREKSTWDEAKNSTVQSAASKAKNWDDLRQSLQAEGLDFEIITRANGNQGLIFVDESGNRIAASKVAADLSHGKLSKIYDQSANLVPPSTKIEKPDFAHKPQKSQWDQYSEQRAEHFHRLGKSPEQIKAELENIKKSKERLWKEYQYKTSLIPQCFEPKYRGMMRGIEREIFEKAKLRLDKQAQSLRDQRFVSFDSWKSGAVRPTPTPKPQKQTLFDKLKAFFNPIASASSKFHQNHTYPPKTQSIAAKQLKSAVITAFATPSGADFFLESEPTVLDAINEALQAGGQKPIIVNSNYANRPRPENTLTAKSTRSNNYVQRNDDGQR